MAPLEPEYIEEEVGIETEDDYAPTPVEARDSVYTTATDWTVETIVSQLRKGNIDLNPAFQRREVWTPAKKSALIESVIFGYPIPQIVLAERRDKRHTFVVLDGKQRLLTLRQFCADSANQADEDYQTLQLSTLKGWKELNGHSYKSLLQDSHHEATIDAFDNHTIRTVIIQAWPDSDYLHRIFQRLNTNSVPLNPQELRQALNPGPFTDFLERYASNSEVLRDALDLTQPDLRMRDNEILLRHLGFVFLASTYRGNLKAFLDQTLQYFNSGWSEYSGTIQQACEECMAAITAAQAVFSKEKSFCVYNGSAGRYETRFNRAVFDVMVFSLRQAETRALSKERKSEVILLFERLCSEDDKFYRSLTTTTKTLDAVNYRFRSWTNGLSDVLQHSIEMPIPELRLS